MAQSVMSAVRDSGPGIVADLFRCGLTHKIWEQVEVMPGGCEPSAYVRQANSFGAAFPVARG